MDLQGICRIFRVTEEDVWNPPFGGPLTGRGGLGCLSAMTYLATSEPLLPHCV